MEYVDLSDKQITRRQHYVPKAYLKNFTPEDKKYLQVYVVFPQNKKAKLVSIDNICCHNYLYDQIAIDSESEAHIFVAPNEIEDSFIAIEGAYSTIISELMADLHSKNAFELSTQDIGKLRGFMASLICRNPVFVHICNCVVDRMYNQDPEYIERIRNTFPDVPPNLFISNVANETLKIFLMISTLAMAQTLEKSQICILRTEDSLFVTSDMPVINLYGIEHGIKYDLLGMPIAPKLFLAFIDADSPIPQVVSIRDCEVKRINGRQTSGARKLLISNSGDLLSYIDFSYEYEKEDDTWLYQMLHVDKETALKEYREIMNSKEIKYWR